MSTSSLVWPSYPWRATILKKCFPQKNVQFNIFHCLKKKIFVKTCKTDPWIGVSLDESYCLLLVGGACSCGHPYFKIWAIDIVIPSGDSNLGLQLPTCLNIVDNLSRLATMAGSLFWQIFSKYNLVYCIYLLINLDTTRQTYSEISNQYLLEFVNIPSQGELRNEDTLTVVQQILIILSLLKYLLLAPQSFNFKCLEFTWSPASYRLPIQQQCPPSPSHQALHR